MINGPEAASNNPLLPGNIGPVDPSPIQRPEANPIEKEQKSSDSQSDQLISSSRQNGGGLYGAHGRFVEPGIASERSGVETEGEKLAGDIQAIQENIESLDPVLNSGELEVMQRSFDQALNTSNALTHSMNGFLLNI